MTFSISGSIRALFQNAKKILEAAVSNLSSEDLNGPPKEIVTMQKVKEELTQSDRVLEIINALSASARNLLVIMALHGFSKSSVQFSMAEAMKVYNISYEQSNKQLPKLEATTALQALQNLVDSSLLEFSKKVSILLKSFATLPLN